MELATNKEIVIPAGYKAYRYNLKYLLDTNYGLEEKREAKRQLCKLLGIGKNMLNKYINDTLEKKRYKLDSEKLQILSKFFKCPMDDLINESDH